MAPRFSTDHSWFQTRQDAASVPACVTTCIASADTTGCTGATDYACLCASTAYQTSVATCWESSCNATEISEGEAYSSAACAAFGVTVSATPQTASATVASSVTPSGTASTTLPSVNVTSAPVVHHQAFVNVQAIMSSICGALLLVAVALAVTSCRTRIKRDYETTQNRTWTGVGTSGFDSKASASKYGISRNSQRGGQTSTFDDYGMTSSNFGGQSGSISMPSSSVNRDRVAAGGGVRGFTNRVAFDEDAEYEEYEMSNKSGKAEADGVAGVGVAEVDSPTSSSSRMGESDIELTSTARLYKGDGPSMPGRAM